MRSTISSLVLLLVAIAAWVLPGARSELLLRPDHMSAAEIAAPVQEQGEQGEVPPYVKGCKNDGSNHGGTRENPTACACFMPCAREAGSTDPQDTQHDRRCKTYCRANDCGCKPPCA